MKKIRQTAGLFLLGSTGYAAIEILWRGYTHWSMALTGGTVLVSLAEVRHRLHGVGLGRRCMAGAACITTAELLVGLTVNRGFGLNVWDYSQEKFNILGQICAKYAGLWFLLSAPAMAAAQKAEKWLAKPAHTRYNARG